MAGGHLLGAPLFGIDVRVARATWTVAVIAGALYCTYAMRTTLLVMLIAVFFSYLVYPLFALLQRSPGRHLPRVVLLSAAFALVIGVIGVAGGEFGSRVAAEATGLGKELSKLLDPATLARRLPLPVMFEPLRDRVASFLHGFLAGGAVETLPVVRGVGTGLVRAVGNLVYVVIVPIFSFLLILEAPALDVVLAWLKNRKNGPLWCSVVRGLNEVLAHYVRALALLSLATLVVYSAVLTLLGAPFALLLAAAAALLEVIPVFGPLAAASAIVAVAGFSGYAHVWWLVGFLVAYRLFQDYMLNPYLMSEGVNLPPLLVVFGLVAGDELAGIPGIFLSVPLLATIRIIVVQVRLHRKAAADSGSTPQAG
jgi:predicted PurR-regulated permease PerM